MATRVRRGRRPARRRGRRRAPRWGTACTRKRPRAARSHVRQGEHVLAVEGDRPAEHLVAGPAHDHGRQRGLAGAVRAHDGVDLAGRHRQVDALQDLLAGHRGSQPADLERASRGSLTHDHVVAVDADLVDGHRLRGRQRLRLAGRRARTCCRASSTRSPCSSQSTSPSDSDTFGVAARVADGVEVVAAAHDGDLVRRRRRSAATVPGASSSQPAHHAPRPRHASLRSSLADTWATSSGTRAGAGSRSSTSSKKPSTMSRSARPGGTPRLSR